MGQQRRPVCACQIHLVDEQERRHLIPFQQVPQCPGVALYAVSTGDHQHGAVQHLQRSFHFGREVYMARGVQQRHTGLPQFQHRLLGKDGNAPLPLHGVGVQKGVLMIHPDGSGPVQQGL